MATPLKRMPRFEPSTDFPTLTDVVEDEAAVRTSRGWIVALVAVGALLVGSLGYLIGRESAPVPSACERAVQLGRQATATAISDLGTIRESMLVFLDGERTEADSILSEARLDVEGLGRLEARLAAAAEDCLSG